MHIFSAVQYVTASVHTLKILNVEQASLIKFASMVFEIVQLKEDSQT